MSILGKFGLDAIGGIVKSIASPVTTWLKGKQAIKAAKVDAEIQIIAAKANHIQKVAEVNQSSEIDWNLKSIENAGWKDEFYVILFSIPLVMCFIPGMDLYVNKGFDALEKCPDWYEWALGIMIASSFGYRKFADTLGKKFNKPGKK